MNTGRGLGNARLGTGRITPRTRWLLVAFSLVFLGPLCFVRGNVNAGTTQAEANCGVTSVGFTPLMDLGTGTYKGMSGGLYPSGAKSPPAEYLANGVEAANAVQPLNGEGLPHATRGKIVLLSIGMSNTKLEYEAFRSLAQKDPERDPSVRVINGAQGGQDAPKLLDPNGRYWQRVDGFLSAKNVTPAQVQVVWLKQAVGGETDPFPSDALELKGYLRTIVQNMEDRFPNLRIVYLSSRIYAGYAVTRLNPEPIAYQTGFAVKWLIEEDIETTEVERPWLAWGPYLWADGLQPRSDGLTWACEEMQDDGTHPSPSGQAKVAQMLLDFFKSNVTSASWFMNN